MRLSCCIWREPGACPVSVARPTSAHWPGALRSPWKRPRREVRYQFLANVATTAGAEVIAVGHNADDQAETVLMHLLRGSGAAGLRGMLPRAELPPSAQRASGATHSSSGATGTPGEARSRSDRGVVRPPPILIRPLLRIPRSAIMGYSRAAWPGNAQRFQQRRQVLLPQSSTPRAAAAARAIQPLHQGDARPLGCRHGCRL